MTEFDDVTTMTTGTERSARGIRLTWSDMAFALSHAGGTDDDQTALLEELEREYEGLL